jgi:hypothetical protein
MAGITQVMLGMGSGPITLLQNHTITGSPEANPSPPPATLGTTCVFTFKSDGTALATPGFSGSTTPAVASGEWLTSGNPADCELFVSETSGTVSAGPTTGALSTWQAMTSDLAYGILTTGSTTKSTTINCQVRNKNTLEVIGTCDITFTIS